jgi:hypothetical protein
MECEGGQLEGSGRLANNFRRVKGQSILRIVPWFYWEVRKFPPQESFLHTTGKPEEAPIPRGTTVNRSKEVFLRYFWEGFLKEI